MRRGTFFCVVGFGALMARWVLATGLAYAVLATAASAGEDAETGPEEVVLPDWTEDTDYYEVLGVEREAGERDIKRAYVLGSGGAHYGADAAPRGSGRAGTGSGPCSTTPTSTHPR